MSKKKILHTETIDNIAVVTLNTPGEKVNKLNEMLIREFSDFLNSLEANNSLDGAVLLSSKENNFIAGADIDMFTQKETAKELSELSWTGHEILLRIEQFSKPIVVGIHGSCMGGGTELALACHYRIVSDHKSTKIGLPEVNLGLLPGMGGTQRLPRLIGIQKALSYMLTGKNMYTQQARKSGFADEVSHQYGVKTASIEAAKKLVNKKVNPKDTRSLTEKLLEENSIGRKIIFKQARKRTKKQTKGNYPAPETIIDSVQYGYKNGFYEGLEYESKQFGELAVTSESRALIQLFYAMNGAKKNPFKKDSPNVKKIAVIGAGLMGSGITEVSANNGIHVWLKDQSIEQVIKGIQPVQKEFDKKVEKKILSAFERDEKIGLIHPTESYRDLQNIDVVIEAVFEDLGVKQSIVKEVEENSTEKTIFASNTSSLPISTIAANASRPENIIGMHYFSPVQKMPLLEIIKTPKTAEWVIETAYELGLKQKKTVIVVNDGPGFYTTRILAPFMNETLLLLEEGAPIEQIDATMKQFGFPVGPVALFDEVGIDVGAHVSDTLRNIFEKRGGKTSKKATELVEAGYKGRKNQQGFYEYTTNSKKKKKVHNKVYTFFGGMDRNEMDTSVIQQRLSLMMINEAVYCLQENILENPVDGDLGAILGLGFPPFLGGPFRYIDREGADVISDKLSAFQQTYGERFKPAPLLLKHAKNGTLFYK